MRIVLATGIYPPDAGGPATYTHALAQALHHAGHHVCVIAYGDMPGIAQEEAGEVERIDRRLALPLRYAAYALAVRRRAKGADVVYLQGCGSEGIPGTIGAQLAGKPTVMKVVGDYAWEIAAGQGEKELLDTFVTHRHKGKIRLLEWLERWAAKRASAIITPSVYLQSIVETWGVPRDHMTVIPNAISALPEGMSRADARATFGVHDRRVLLTAIRAVPWKGGDFLISLLTELPTDILLVIAGDGPALAQWKELAEQQRVTNRVRFLGRVDRKTLANWYRAADVFALASGYEGYPWVVAEAASVGLPSMVSDKGGNPETRAQLGADLVTVLPYQDRAAWVAALSKPWPSRAPSATKPLPTAEQMLTETLHTLSTVL